MVRIACFAFWGLLFCFQTVAAQTPAPNDSVVYAYLPYMKYASDTGLEGGLILNRYHYQDDVSPFITHGDFRLWGTTKGLFSALARWNVTETFDTSLRSHVELRGERRLNDIFFPIGHDSPFQQALWDNDYYFFDSWKFQAIFEGRLPLYREGHQKLDVLLLAGSIFSGTADDLENTSMGDFRPLGIDDSWLGYTGLGLIFDSRNNEFDPQTGIFARMQMKGSPGWVSDYPMYGFATDLRGFYSIAALGDLTLAGRLAGEFTGGDLPYWFLPEAGGELTLRGYPTGRFRDNSAIYSSLELRKWLFGIDFLKMRFGLMANTDAGRVFSGFPSSDALFSEYHRAYGGGILISAFTPDFFIRVQTAYSDEMSRMYMNIGFVF